MSARQRRDPLERVNETVPFGLNVVMGLKVQPELVAGSEVAGEAQRGVGCDSTGTVDNLVDPPRRYADRDCDPALCEPERSQVLVLEDLARVDGGVKAMDHGGSSFGSVVVGDLHVVCSCGGPAKADAPLVVDPDAVAAGSVATELLQLVSRRDPKVVEGPSSVEQKQLAVRGAVDRWPEPTCASAMPDGLGVAISE